MQVSTMPKTFVQCEMAHCCQTSRSLACCVCIPPKSIGFLSDPSEVSNHVFPDFDHMQVCHWCFSSATGLLPGASNARFSWPKSSLVWIDAYFCLGGTETISLSLRLELRTEGTFQLSGGVLNHVFFSQVRL